MKKLILTALLVLFIWNVSGVDYKTSMIGDDLSKNFDIEGWALSENSSQTEVTVKYYIEFVNRNYDYTEPTEFNLNLIDGDHLVAQKQMEVGRLDLGENTSGIVEISSERPPDRINELEFKSNHTMSQESGDDSQTVSKAQIDFNPSEISPLITSLESSTSIAERGQNISLRAYTEDIQNLSVNGNEMRKGNDYFLGDAEVPSDIGAGERQLNYSFRTGRGSKFEESVNITINNKPPVINLSLNNSVKKGNPVKVRVEIEDDREVVNNSLRFDGESYELENGKASIETIGLYTGQYTLEVRAVDSDGAYSSETETIKLYRENLEDVSDEENNTINKTSESSEDTEKEPDSSENDSSQEISSDEENDGYMGFNELVIQPVKKLAMSLIEKIPM